MASIVPLDASQPIVDENGIMSPRFRVWQQQVSDLSIIEGTGSPEGVIEATTSRLYMDRTASTGTIVYIKQFSNLLQDRKKGWVLV